MLAATTLVVAACGSGGDDYARRRRRRLPTPRPSISAIADRSVDQDTVLGPIEFGIADQRIRGRLADADRGRLDGGGVFPADGVVLGGRGASRTLTLTPLEAGDGHGERDGDAQRIRKDWRPLAPFRVDVNARSASMRDVALTTFAKVETDEATPVNGFTFQQDADDPAIFEPLTWETSDEGSSTFLTLLAFAAAAQLAAAATDRFVPADPGFVWPAWIGRARSRAAMPWSSPGAPTASG